jgi:hypothetical protein
MVCCFFLQLIITIKIYYLLSCLQQMTIKVTRRSSFIFLIWSEKNAPPINDISREKKITRVNANDNGIRITFYFLSKLVRSQLVESSCIAATITGRYIEEKQEDANIYNRLFFFKWEKKKVWLQNNIDIDIPSLTKYTIIIMLNLLRHRYVLPITVLDFFLLLLHRLIRNFDSIVFFRTYISIQFASPFEDKCCYSGMGTYDYLVIPNVW